jgi:hypothetical protein
MIFLDIILIYILTIMMFYTLVLVFQYRAYERGVQSVYIGPGL